MSVVRVKVPASTANLGPGFDCLGIALQIYNWITVQREASVHSDGMVEGASAAFFRRTAGRPFSFRWEIRGEVPRSRGLGSSVTVRLGVLHGLNELAGSPLTRQEVFELCAELEGHPDNAAPAAFGGFTIARAGGYFQRYRVDRALGFALLIPDFEVSTSDARRVLPKTLPLADAAVSVSNACAIAGAFAARDIRETRRMLRRSPAPAISRKIGSFPFGCDRRRNGGGRSRRLAQRFGIHRGLSRAGKG